MARPLRTLLWLACLVVALGLASCGKKNGKPLRLATTTSMVDSGLLAALLPAFEKTSGCQVEVEAVGSGKALAMLAAGDADVAITHAPVEEQNAVSAGHAARRTRFMHNELVIAGPKDKLGLVAGAGDFRDVLKRIAASGRTFVSRGDGSGTHLREQALWQSAGLPSSGGNIVAAQAGMRETLELASKKGAFTLTDRATFLSLRDGLELAIVFQGDDELRNDYAVLEPAEKAEGSSRDGARALTSFLRSAEGRALIGGFGVEKLQESLFTPEE